MDDNKQRTTWTTRISVLPETKDAIRRIATAERVPMAYIVGVALDQYVAPAKDKA